MNDFNSPLNKTVDNSSNDYDLETPNAVTIAAMEECIEMSRHPERYKKYSSFAELMNEIMANDEE